MDTWYLDWSALGLILAGLAATARHFTRRTYRITLVLVVVLGIIAVTGYGMDLTGGANGVGAALPAAGNELAQHMFGPLLPGPAGQHLTLGLAGWLAVLVILLAILVWLDTISIRREQPRVSVEQPPASSPAGPNSDPGSADRSVIAEELQFRLPAVEVRKPGVMPGGSTLDNLASLVSESGLQGSQLTAALMRAVHALEAKPRSYQARLFVERWGPAVSDPGAGMVRVTVDLRDVRGGTSLAVRALPPCQRRDAAEQVAGFTARQVFYRDPATPEWAVGSPDGDDLYAYLLEREMCPQSATFGDVVRCRHAQRSVLDRAVRPNAKAGLVQYELAGLCDLDGDNLQSLLLHLRNRVHHPHFLRGRYRLAMSFSMMTIPAIFEGQWLGTGTSGGRRRELAGLRKEVRKALAHSGLLAGLSPGEREALMGRARHTHLDGDTPTLARLALLRLAEQEFRSYLRWMRPMSLLGYAFWRRSERDAFLALLRTPPAWWRHPRIRCLATTIALDMVRVRRMALTDPEGAGRELAAAQSRCRRALHLDAGGGRWVYGRMPWQAVYNAACLHALPDSSGEPSPAAAHTAVTLLRLTISDPECELVRPSEWMAVDPDLRTLRPVEEFQAFVREQARADFDPGGGSEIGDPWFRALLPRLPAAPPAGPGAAIPSGLGLSVDGAAQMSVNRRRAQAHAAAGRHGGHSSRRRS